jgi:D-alanyl-D-alanine carboxypeptidase
MIQIGATDDAIKANELLARAMGKGLGSLGAAKPLTEKVHKGSETFYRARFVGLKARTAEAACKSLKRSGFACFATRN